MLSNVATEHLNCSVDMRCSADYFVYYRYVAMMAEVLRFSLAWCDLLSEQC